MMDKSLFGLPGVHKALAILLLSALLQAALVLGQAFTLSAAIVNMWNGAAAQAQLGLLAAFFACYLGRQLVLFAQQRFLDTFAHDRAAELRRGLLERIFASRTKVVRDNGTAAVTAAALEGTDQVETYLKLILPKMVGMMAIPLAILVAVFAHDWVSGVILLVMFPVIIFFMIMLGRTAKAKAEAQYGTYQQLSNHFIDTLRGIDTLAAFGASGRERSRIWQVSERFRRATVDTLKVATLSSAVLDICTVFGIGAVAIMLGLRLADHSMMLATALPILVMAPDYFKPIRDFAGDFHASLDGKNALADIARMTAGTQESDEEDSQAHAPSDETAAVLTQHPSDADSAGQTAALPAQQQAGDMPPMPALEPWNSASTLELQDVSFGYEPERLALEGVSLRAKGFAKIGIVGTSGAGKSTLANLLGGFEAPDAGSIAIDGENLPHLGFDEWQSQALYIPQDPYLFHATLRDNIAFYTPDVSDDQIARAVDVVGLRPLVDELPDGLDTVVGEGGRGLSGGQAQRIALARVLLDPTRKVLVFDEPTAHLDIETELELKQRMLPLMEGHLVLFATHRLHWLHEMDHVVVMEAGRIVEQGTPAELLAAGGKLADLAHNMNAGLAVDETSRCQTASAKATEHVTSESVASLEGAAAPDRLAHDSSASGATPQGDARPHVASRDDAAQRKASNARWVRPYLGHYRKQLALALLLGLATFACSALLMYTAGFLISWTADPALPTLAAAMYAIALVQIFGLGRPITRYAERLVSHDWVFRMTSSLRVRLYGILEARAMHVRRDSQLGEFLGLVVDDIGHLQNLFLRTLFPVAIAGVLYVAVVVFFGAFDLRFALFVLVATGLCVIALPALSRKVNGERIRLRKQYRSELYTQLTDNVLGAADWVYSGRGAQYLHRHEADQQREHAIQQKLDSYDHVNDLVQSAIFGIIAVMVTLWAGIHFASGGIGGTSNWVAAFALGFFPLVEAFAPVANAVTQAETHTETIARLGSLPEEGDEDYVQAADELQCATSTDPEPTTAASEPAVVPQPRAALGLDAQSVSYTYPGATSPALDNLTLHITAGQKVAILGRSGTGKSTLAQVLRGDITPQAGTVRIGAQPVSEIGNAMHEFIGLVQQQTYLFNRTLRENLALAKPNATDEELWEALRQVHMDDVARRLPQGLDTVLDEAGTQFSGGERHRLALARVLLADVPIVLLDEPMVGLDPGIEHELLETLFSSCADKTVVMVTHHLQDIARFDRVAFVESGRIELDGPPAELAATSARFRSLLTFDAGC